MVALEVPAEYGYVVLVAIVSVFVLLWMGIQVGKARKQFNVPYPTMYDNEKPQFNCYQRAHQNTLENYTGVIMLLLLGGLKHPLVCAIGGAVYFIGRISYAKGYYTGDPKNRSRGFYMYFGLLAMLYSAIALSVSLITAK